MHCYLASFVSGPGYLPEARDLADRNLFLGGMAADNYVAFYPNSAVLANMHRWPAVLFAKGLWDRAESLEGTVAAFDRVRGLKDIVVVRGPHSIETWPQQEIDRVRDRMVQFAVAAVQGRTAYRAGRPGPTSRNWWPRARICGNRRLGRDDTAMSAASTAAELTRWSSTRLNVGYLSGATAGRKRSIRRPPVLAMHVNAGELAYPTLDTTSP